MISAFRLTLPELEDHLGRGGVHGEQPLEGQRRVAVAPRLAQQHRQGHARRLAEQPDRLPGAVQPGRRYLLVDSWPRFRQGFRVGTGMNYYPVTVEVKYVGLVTVFLHVPQDRPAAVP